MENLPDQIPTVEKQANFEGNWSEALFDRMRDPIIRNQLIDLYHQEELARAEYYRTEPFKFLFERDNGEKVFEDTRGHQVLEEEIKSFKSKTREEIEKWCDENLAEVMSVTVIKFSKSAPTASGMPLDFVDPFTGKPLTVRQKSMIEAHEKGHALRQFEGDLFQNRFMAGFDRSKVTLDSKLIETLRKLKAEDAEVGGYALPEETDEELIENHLDYLFRANELAERMAQLKNYFGMHGSDQFTREHLEYAREHYLKDVDFDNSMTQFFQGITPETEEEFLRIINNSGI